jgi:uncharacterized protein YhjY with autotransporter beta-barrel domain
MRLPDRLTTGATGATLTVATAILALNLFLQHDAVAQAVELGTASDFAVLAGSGITNTGATTITGNVGSFPTTSQTGFGSVTLNGTNQGGNAVTQQAKSDLTTAYGTAAGRAATITYAPGSDLGGLTLASGVYNNPSSFGLTGTLTLDGKGDPSSVWIFQAGSTLGTASGSKVVLINGADGCNIFWQVGSSAVLGTGSILYGTILAMTSITANTGAVINGRLLAQNGAVTLDTNTIAAEICKTIINGPDTTDTGTNPKDTNTASKETSTKAKDTNTVSAIASLKKALIIAEKQVDVFTSAGLTSIYTQGFAQFDTEVFAVQQRFADLREGTGTPRGQDVYNSTPTPVEKDSWGGKNPSGGKNSWNGRRGEGIQPPQVQFADDDRWGFFITATGDFATVGDRSKSYGFHGESLGTTLGVDCRLSDHFVLGVSVGYTHTNSDLYPGGTLDTDGGKAAIYATYYRDGFFSEGLIGGGYNSYDSKRLALIGRGIGSSTGEQFDAYYGLGYDVRMGKFTLTPMASLLYSLVGINGFNERGSLVPLHIESQHESSLRVRVGPRLAYTGMVGHLRVTPSISAQWQHECLDDQYPLNARFLGSGSLFTVMGPRIGRDSALLTAALNVAWSSYAAYLAYQVDLNRRNYEDQTVLAGFRVSW